MRIIELTGTCSAGGALTLTSTKPIKGYLEKIIYDYQDGATGSDFVITCTDVVEEAILGVTNAGVANVTWYPRSLGNKVADASAFTDVAEKMFFTEGKFKVVVAQGGATKDFRFLFVVSDE